MRDWVLDFFSDLRFAARAFGKRAGFAAVAIVTLALGIAAATTVFSIVDAVLLRPLPYKNPEGLVAVWITGTREPGLAKLFATHRDFVEFRSHAQTLENVSVATWATSNMRVLTGAGPSRELFTIPASATFFETLGVSAAMGRVFTSSDNGCMLVVSHAFWKSTLGADASAVGRNLTLDQKECTVLGVMPEKFSFYPTQTQAWALLGPDYQANQDQMLVGIFARLKPGVTATQAQAELRSLFRAIHTDAEMRDFEPVVYALGGEFTFLAGRTLRATLILVFASVLLLLLISCMNVANLFLSRLSERRRELAVRAALGSGQGRLVRQVLTEGLLLSTLGTVLGVAIAYAALWYFRAAKPIELSVGADLRMNLPVLAFSLALSIATTLIFGLLPALRASKINLADHLRAAGRGSVQGRHRFAKVVVGAEMALSFVLLMGAGLLIISAMRMGSEPLGFQFDHVATTRVALPNYRYTTDAQRTLVYDQLLERLERMPGTMGVALTSKLPPEAGGNQVLEIQGRPVEQGSGMHDVGADAVSPRFFDVLTIPVRRGRVFTEGDRPISAPVAVVNEALVREYFPHADPIGQQIRLAGGVMPWLTVVGVVGNLKHTQLMNEMSWVETPIFYRPLTQEPRRSIQIAVRGAGPMSEEMQREIAAVDPAIPLVEIEPLASRLARTLAYPRFRAMVLAMFALGALMLAAVGLHGVLAHMVTQRIPEFGVRRAVGAQTRDLLLLIAWQGGVPVLAGLGAGIALTLLFSRVLANLLYGIQPADPKVLAAVSLAMLAAASLAVMLPAGRAARVDPMTALRDE